MRRWLAAAAMAAIAACHHERPVAMEPLPRAAYAHYLAGRLDEIGGEFPAAVDDLRAAAAAAPDQPMIAIALAHALAKAARDGEARAVLAKLRAAWPDHAPVWLASGELLAASDPAAARAAYRRATELAPDDERAYLGLAKLEPATAAEATLRALVAHAPGSAQGHYQLAIRLAARDVPAAIGELRRVLELDPDQIDARLDLARALRRIGKLADAIAQLRSAFDRTGQALDVAEELFYLLCEADQLDSAGDLLTLLDDDRSDLEALVVVARLDLGLGRLAAASAVTARITALDGDAGAIAQAELAAASGDDVAATIQLVLSVPASSKQYSAARLVAADLYLSSGDADHARSALAPVRATPPAELAIAIARVDAFALVDLDRAADARAELAALRVAAERAGELAIARAEVTERAGDRVGAIAIVEAELAAHPDDAAAANLAGYWLAEAHQRLPDAERDLRLARDRLPGDAGVLDSWGYLQLQLGHARDATSALDRASRIAPREPEIWIHLARAQAAAGVPALAQRALDQAASLRLSPAVRRELASARAELSKPAPGP